MGNIFIKTLLQSIPHITYHTINNLVYAHHAIQ